MDYTQDMVRLHKAGPGGADVYNISVQGGMIVLESGPLGRRPHRMNYPMADKPKIDKLVAQLLEKGYSPMEKTFGPWAAAKGADQWRNQLQHTKSSKKKFGMGGGF